MIIIWFDDWKYQTRMVIIVMKTDIIWSLLRPAREVGGRLWSWLSYKILKIIRKLSAFSKYCLRNWETSIIGLRMVTSRFWNYLQCCQLLIVLEGIRSDGGDAIAGYIAEKQVSQVTIGRIGPNISSFIRASSMDTPLTTVGDMNLSSLSDSSSPPTTTLPRVLSRRDWSLVKWRSETILQ